jgi:hypothetical protein
MPARPSDIGDTLADSDRQALINLIVEFAWRVDHKSADTIHELVTDDIFMQMSYGPMVGKDEIKAWGVKRAAVERITRHVMSNFRFRATGDGKVEANSSAIIFRSEGLEMSPPTPWAVSECTDIFVRQNGTWKFASHIAADIYRFPE